MIQLSPAFEQTIGHAIYSLGLCGNTFRPGSGAFYIMRYQSFQRFAEQTGETAWIVKIGESESVAERFKHHFSSFPGWEHLMVIESEASHQIQEFFKKLLFGYKFKNSPEVFTLSDPQLRRVVILTAYMSYDESTTLPDSELDLNRSLFPETFKDESS